MDEAQVRYMYDHERAMRLPKGAEVGVVRMFEGLNAYAWSHRSRYGSTIGEDYVLGEHFRDMCHAFLGLLNGETGRLDCGTLDGAVRQLCTEHGVELDQ